jgi:hypothetical protein
MENRQRFAGKAAMMKKQLRRPAVIRSTWYLAAAHPVL